MTVFLDEKNVYKGARRAFFNEKVDHFTIGNFSPKKLADLLCSRLPPSVEKRELREVRLYTGMPSPSMEPNSNSAHEKQASFWRSEGATVISRPLRYPNKIPPGEQKGVDVALAIDFVTMSIDGQYDIGIIFSNDTDLRPALEFVAKRDCHKPEVACWWSPANRSYLSISDAKLWCHRLSVDDYKEVCDYTDYNR